MPHEPPVQPNAQSDDQRRTLHSPAGSSATVQALGAMLAPVVFRAPGHADFAPLQIPPWADEPGWDRLDPGLRHLRGEWPCVPFGRVDRPADLRVEWAARDPGDRWGHGYAMHHAWRWVDDDDARNLSSNNNGNKASSLALAIDLPMIDVRDGAPTCAPASIARLERRIRWSDSGSHDNTAALDIELRIHAREAIECPVALHPTLRLDAGRVRLRLPAHGGGHTYPVAAEPGTSRLAVDASFTSLDAVPLARTQAHMQPQPRDRTADPTQDRSHKNPLTLALSQGQPERHHEQSCDLTRYPQPTDGEDLLQLTNLQGPVHADYLDLGWTLTLDWDRSLLPDLMLWISHAGRQHAPWNGRHRALGIEPVAGPFDLGRIAEPPPDHPIASRHGLRLSPNAPTRITLRLSARPMR